MTDDDIAMLIAEALEELSPEMQARIEHVCREINEASRRGESTVDLFDKVNGKEGVWRPDRENLQINLVDALLAGADQVPAERHAIMMGGLSGSGKSSILRTEWSEQFGVELSAENDINNFLVVNSDDFKQTLLERGAGPQVNELSPLETSALVHEESGVMATDLAQRAAVRGKNLIWDTTLGSLDEAEQRLDELEEIGYYATGVFVDVSIKHAVRASLQRYTEGETRLLTEGAGLGGRFVPPDVIVKRYDPTGTFKSSNRANFETLKGRFKEYFVFDNENFQTRLVEHGP